MIKDFCIGSIIISDGNTSTSLYPTIATASFGTTYTKGSKTWTNVSAFIANSITTNYALNLMEKQGENKDETHCTFNASTIKNGSGFTFTYTNGDHDNNNHQGDDNGNNNANHSNENSSIGGDYTTKFVIKTYANGVKRLQEHYHTIELNDNTKINAHLHYEDSKNTTDLELTYVNDDHKKSCDDTVTKKRDDDKKSCKKNDKTCVSKADDDYVKNSNDCRDHNNYNIKKTYTGYRTLSLYDILTLVGLK